MNQQYLFDPIPCDKYDLLSKDELIGLSKDQADLIKQMQKALENAHAKILGEQQQSFLLGEQLFNIKNKIFGRSSEKSKKEPKGKKEKKKNNGKKKIRLPSEKYKNLDIVEKEIEFDQNPSCNICNNEMKDSGLIETLEYLTFIPRKYYIVREKKHKYRCSCCQESLVTTPAIPRIIPGGAYSDEMIIDVTMSKFLDLIPIERYTKIAEREGLEDLPANSLINTTHKLADYIEASYKIIKKEVFNDEVIHADETPHRMLEGDKKSNWYTWGFSTRKASYFELRDTRSGDVASDLLIDSNCKYLVSDVYSGYKKAVSEANIKREVKIEHLYCNAHARRKFKDSEKNFGAESNYFLNLYKRIYRLESENYESKLSIEDKRRWQRIYLRLMEREALKLKFSYSKHSSISKALNYFLNNFEGLSRFTKSNYLPLDNNSQERQLRSPVIGRKTWYGTHSKRGAKTTEIMFSIVHSCKLNNLNPRKYLKALVRALHEGKGAFSPNEYRNTIENKTATDAN